MKNILSIFLISLIFSTTLFAEDVPDLNRAEKYQAKIPVEVVKEIKLPKGYHEGLYWDGKNVWVCNGEDGDIWIVDPSQGKVIDRITPIGTFTEGITAYGDGTYWLTDWNSKKLYRVKIDSGAMISDYEISLDPAHPAGVLWTGDHLYVITWTRGIGTKYHLMELDDREHMHKKMIIKRIHEPAHMAWDGSYLWITSWYTPLVYKVDVNNFKVLGSFKSPVSDTTGIVWDGEYFWVTGTKSDLYKIKLLPE